ncbi:MAG: mycofactocin biosynthesis chaperone MftB [Actinomycetota bacterium]|nr:mycofactocin biosynthesis chaperone MftB [Actinomycetota bacterium]
MSTDLIAHPLLQQPLALHPQVAVRPEPFGALAYHYGNRRLVFLQHVDMVTVAKALADHPSLAEALTTCHIAPSRWPSFAKAFASLLESEVVVVRDPAEGLPR